MRQTLLWLVLVCSGPCVAQSVTVTPLWEYVDGPAGAWSDKPALADLDADGSDEVVVLLQGYSNFGSSRGLAVAGHDGADGWRWTQILHGQGELRAPLLVSPHADGDRIVVLRRGWDPTVGEILDIVQFGGDPLRELSARRIDAGDQITLLATGDVDGDGQVDVLEHVQSFWPAPPQLRARNPASGDLLWSRDVPQLVRIELGQLDGDPALEIVVAASPGLVLDGLLGSLEWSYAGGFSSLLGIGNFNADTSDREFVSMSHQSAVVFRTNPYSPVYDLSLPCCVSLLTVADIDDDGIDEWVAGWSSALWFIEPGDGAYTSLETPDLSPQSVAFDDPDNDGAFEFVVNGYAYNGRSRLQVIDAHTGTAEFDSQASATHAFPMLAADLAGQGGEELAYVVTRDSLPTLTILDAATGALLRSAPVPELMGSPGPIALAAAQLDADPALELAIAVRGGGSSVSVVVLDALDFSRAWTLGDAQLPYGASDVAFADIDADGDIELVVLAAETRVRVFAGASGAPMWNTIALGGQGGADLELVDVDADPALEILVGDGRDVYAFDGATRLLDWSAGGGWTERKMVVHERNGDCRVALYGGASYQEFACATGQPGVPVSLQSGLMRLLPRRLDGDALLGVNDGRLVAFDTVSGDITPVSAVLGNYVGVGDQSAVVLDGGDVLLGNDGVVTRLGIGSDVVFADGFE